MMALGLVAYNFLATHPKVNISTIVPIINCATLMVTVMGGVLLFSEGFTTKKLIGLGLLIIGIVLLRPGGE